MVDNKINEVRQASDIVDIISSYLPLTQKGKNYFGVCPFHEDGDPSLSVSPDKQIFSCFSCHTAGNVFKFLSFLMRCCFFPFLLILLCLVL